MNIGIIGAGNVGGSFGVALERAGHSVLFQDISDEMLKSYDRTTKSIQELCRCCEVIFECVPTEDAGDGHCDLSILEAVSREVASYEHEEWCRCVAYVQRSTVPPGTAARFASLFRRIKYVVNPSFLVMATKMEDSWWPDKVTLGIFGGDGVAEKLMRRVYEWIPDDRIFVSTPTTIEVAKYIENALQSSLLSFWNNAWLVARKAEVEEHFPELLRIVCKTPDLSVTGRVPGQAFGGACLPKDIRALVVWCDENGVSCPFFSGVKEMNELMEELYGICETSAINLYEVESGKFRLK
jgi:nucleotide sugar dehydrogenase